jgi:hypothetical protein
MGTRGIWGFYKDGDTKVTYNHLDSYPTWLGEHIREFVDGHDISEMKTIFDKIIMVDEHNSEPTQEQIDECSEYLSLSVSSQSEKDWYCLLRNSHGDPEAYANGLRYMIESQMFLQDSLFCEWGYILNLDDESVEVYRGFQKKSDAKTRYKVSSPISQGYWHCKLERVIPMEEFAKMDMQQLENSVYETEE